MLRAPALNWLKIGTTLSLITVCQNQLHSCRQNCHQANFLSILLTILLVYYRDSNSPITVLTGLEYWLDNLMCNVPEIAMCYHLGGFVQVSTLAKIYSEILSKL